MAVGTAPPPTAALPCRRRLRDRIHSERQVVGGLLKKAQALVARRKDSGRFLRPENTRSEATATDGAASAKRRKTSPIVEVEVEVIEPAMPKAQRDRLYGLLSSLSAEMPLPPHIVDMMRRQCCCVVDPNGDAMDIDLGSTKDASLFQLLNLLEEFAQQIKIQRLEEEDQEPPKIEAVDASDAISRSSICQLEEGEIADEGADMDVDIFGGVSPLVVDEVHFLPLPKQEDISGGASPVAVQKFPQTPSSNCSPPGSSCSCSSSCSSGSDSDSDDDSASSSPHTAEGPIEAVAKPLEQQEVTEQDEKLTERAASPATQMKEIISRAQEKQKLRCEAERKMAREELEQMKKRAQPVYDDIDPTIMKQLGISGEVQYIVSPVKSRDSVRRRGGGLLQKLGFFLKAE
ncbi:hypothetical protein E2562_032476 [Oryza meyeriana var. granulata]|uniref:NET domain-containing protein n=1 Tax=Oryza meyeriana var. granulata TaxID=110450 RepID=A0A6G1ES09_9ORYZ|nr:hypothetical protein E2562_032476 [Oryza meyeriana var. granulata]